MSTESVDGKTPVSTELSVGGVPVATYESAPALDIRLGPRPYLHPVRTLGGVTVTDALCEDHPWHLGASLAMQDVNGVNFWGGRTYVRGRGYEWLDDHGRIVPAGGSFHWQDQHGTILLTEERELSAHVTPEGWQLTLSYALSAPAGTDVTLGSPATNGRPGGAGYGGFFWRAAPAPPASGTRAPATASAPGAGAAGEVLAFTESAVGEEKVNGSADPWLALRAGDAYTLVFKGLRGDDRWFVRTGDYPGVCAALAFEKPLVIPAGTSIERVITVLVADGSLELPTAPGTPTAAAASPRIPAAPR